MKLPLPFQKISNLGFLIAIITFFMRAGHFMSLPFLAIYLSKEQIFSPSQIGVILGAAGFLFSITGLFNGLYVDRRSHKNLLMVGLVLAALCYFSFTYSLKYFYLLLLFNAALGWMRSLIEVCAVKMMVSNTPPENLSATYSLRFIGMNLGVAIGPLIGAIMVAHHSFSMFFIAGGINIVIAIALIFYQDAPKILEKTHPAPVLSHFKEVFKDKLLLLVTFINFIIWLDYSQLDTTLPQYLAHHWASPANLFSLMMGINALICVFFQTLILRWAEFASLRLSGMLGSFLFGLSFLLISLWPNSTVMIIAVIIMSFAELFTMPINGLLIMRSSPKHLIASYYGFTNLSLLGISLGPILGGFGLEWIGGRNLFLLDALIPLVAVFCYARYIPD